MARFLLACLFLTISTWAEPRTALRGKVQADPATDFSMLRIVVLDANERTELASGRLHNDGTFQFRDLPNTVVELQLLSPHGDSLLQWFAALPAGEPVNMKLPGNGVGAGTAVSLYRMKYKPTEAAQRHWNRAVDALKRHQREEAVPELEQALKNSPDFADAHEHRGLIALAHGQYGLAAEHLVRAAELDPGDAQFLSNAALACLAISRDRDAEQYARAMLRIEPANERGYFILGTALARQDRNREEAASALERAQGVFPEARRALKMLR